MSDILNPEGYLVFQFYQYSQCDGSVQSATAVAIGRCVPTGFIGFPYSNDYAFYTINSVTNEYTAVGYADENCTIPSETIVEEIHACYNVGTPTKAYYSSTLPDYSNGYLEQTFYDFSGPQPSNCTNATVLNKSFYLDKCLPNCGNGGQSCLFSGCAPDNDLGDIGLISFYEGTGDSNWCTRSDTVFIETSVLTSDCEVKYTCLSRSSSSDNELSSAAVAGITFACTFVACIIGFYVFMRFWKRDRGSELTKSLV